MTPEYWEKERRNNYAINSEHSLEASDYMEIRFQMTLWEIRSLEVAWDGPIEEEL
jgi:hypothetical protein